MAVWNRKVLFPTTPTACQHFVVTGDTFFLLVLNGSQEGSQGEALPCILLFSPLYSSLTTLPITCPTFLPFSRLLSFFVISPRSQTISLFFSPHRFLHQKGETEPFWTKLSHKHESNNVGSLFLWCWYAKSGQPFLCFGHWISSLLCDFH